MYISYNTYNIDMQYIQLQTYMIICIWKYKLCELFLVMFCSLPKQFDSQFFACDAFLDHWGLLAGNLSSPRSCVEFNLWWTTDLQRNCFEKAAFPRKNNIHWMSIFQEHFFPPGNEGVRATYTWTSKTVATMPCVCCCWMCKWHADAISFSGLRDSLVSDCGRFEIPEWN